MPLTWRQLAAKINAMDEEKLDKPAAVELVNGSTAYTIKDLERQWLYPVMTLVDNSTIIAVTG